MSEASGVVKRVGVRVGLSYETRLPDGSGLTVRTVHVVRHVRR